MIKDKIKFKKLLSGKNVEKFMEFLNCYKQYVGLSDWNIIFGIGHFDDETLAETESSLLEKTLKIAVKEDFFKYGLDRQKNILFHELIHVRICIFSKKYENIKETEVEYMVNDLVRGFERLKALTFKGEKRK